MYERCHQGYYSTYNDVIIRCFILLGSMFASTGRYLPIHWNTTYYYSAVTPHALRARVVIVYRYILVLVRALNASYNFYNIIRYVTRVHLFLSFFV